MTEISKGVFVIDSEKFLEVSKLRYEKDPVLNSECKVRMNLYLEIHDSKNENNDNNSTINS